MKLITNEQQDQLLANGRAVLDAIRAGIAVDPTPLVKLHTPDGFAVWLLTELNPHDGDCACGLRDTGHGRPALGYVLLRDLEKPQGPHNDCVVCDAHFVARKPPVCMRSGGVRQRSHRVA
jgi:hypothetical protein